MRTANFSRSSNRSDDAARPRWKVALQLREIPIVSDLFDFDRAVAAEMI